MESLQDDIQKLASSLSKIELESCPSISAELMEALQDDIQNLTSSLSKIEMARAQSSHSEVEGHVYSDEESQLEDKKPTLSEIYGSDTSDEEEMEWRREGVSPDEIFSRLEARKRRQLREVRERREKLLLGANSFAEFLERHPRLPTLEEMIGDSTLENDSDPEQETMRNDEPIDPTMELEHQAGPGESVLEESDQEDQESSDETNPEKSDDDADMTAVQLRRSTRVRVKPDRYAPSFQKPKMKKRRRAAK